MAEKTNEENLAEVPDGEDFPYHRGGGHYVLSDGSTAQGKDAAEEQQAALDGTTTDAPEGDDSGATVGDGTGLESLAVDRETNAGDTGETIGDDEDDPRRNLPVAGLPVIGRAESGEPIVAGGVPSDSGVPAEAVGTTDPTIGVSASTDTLLAAHEADREAWQSMDDDDPSYDGSPADRLKRHGHQNPTDGGTATDVDD